ncbi:DivIVA domain-containing protein [Micromonospora sp. NPDC049089]|uniref:DivIVA domain-containing protein n=1 Tax=Micromonospora sp. NPDC049089 TaxID=3155496 RepID=UPI0033EA2462
MRRLLPQHVRAATFSVRRWRGLDPIQVYAYLGLLADELERLTRDLATANTEGERVRQALRQWQSRHTDCRHTSAAPNSRWSR